MILSTGLMALKLQIFQVTFSCLLLEKHVQWADDCSVVAMELVCSRAYLLSKMLSVSAQDELHNESGKRDEIKQRPSAKTF